MKGKGFKCQDVYAWRGLTKVKFWSRYLDIIARKQNSIKMGSLDFRVSQDLVTQNFWKNPDAPTVLIVKKLDSFLGLSHFRWEAHYALFMTKNKLIKLSRAACTGIHWLIKMYHFSYKKTIFSRLRYHAYRVLRGLPKTMLKS